MPCKASAYSTRYQYATSNPRLETMVSSFILVVQRVKWAAEGAGLEQRNRRQSSPTNNRTDFASSTRASCCCNKESWCASIVLRIQQRTEVLVLVHSLGTGQQLRLPRLPCRLRFSAYAGVLPLYDRTWHSATTQLIAPDTYLYGYFVPGTSLFGNIRSF